MPACEQPPPDKKVFARSVGHELLVKHGKHKYYSREQITSSCRELGYVIDWHCWAMCLFMEPVEFNLYHESIGESCDLLEMKSQMVDAVTDGQSYSWFEMDLSWLEWPDIDMSDLFDFFDWTP